MGIENIVAKDVRISRSMVDLFRESTQDTNKLHEEVALGYQIAFFLKSLSDSNCSDGLLCETQENKFHKPVAIDAVVWAKAEIQYDAPRMVKMTLYTGSPDTQPVATSELTYVRELASPPSQLGGHPFQLRRSDAIHVARGTVQERPDYLGLAVGLTSPALFKDGEAAVFQAREQGREPVYLQQAITFRAGAYRLGENDHINISTNCATLRAGRRLYQPTAIITHHEQEIAQVKSTLTFAPRQDILEAIAASKGGFQ
jgi:hypothetical protein